MINIKMNTPTAPTAAKPSLAPKILVIGVGGAGGNGVENMKDSDCKLIVANTDAQALAHSTIETKIQLGEHVTGGLGAGSKPEIGRAAAEESIEDIMDHLEGVNMAFVTAGMGGGTGTGAAPIIAKACRDMGILTVGVVTKPFHFEGSHRMKIAEDGIKQMQEYVDTLIVIPNQNLFRVASEKTTFSEAFVMSDSVLQSGVRGVTDLIMRPGLVNLDFADIRTAMMEMGKAMMGTGEAEGEKRAIEAAESAINNPLLDDVSMKGARGLIINVTGGYDMTLFEADEAANRIREEVDPDANIIFGATFDDKMEGKMRVSIVATGIDKAAEENAKSTGGAGSMMRAKPQTISAPTSSTSVTAPVTAPISAKPVMASPSVPKQTISAPVSHTTTTMDNPIDSPDLDMFEQQEFTNFPSADVKIDVPQNTILRGSRYNNAFIPPKPVGPSYGTTPQGFHGYRQQAGQQNQPVAHNTPAQSGGLVLNPPKLPTPQERKKTPSLFERISGTVQQGIDSLKGTQGQDRPEQQRQLHNRMDAPSFSNNNPAQVSQTIDTKGQSPLSAPAQGQLNIDTPSASRNDSDLDIPAFLRRQAN